MSQGNYFIITNNPLVLEKLGEKMCIRDSIEGYQRPCCGAYDHGDRYP